MVGTCLHTRQDVKNTHLLRLAHSLLQSCELEEPPENVVFLLLFFCGAYFGNIPPLTKTRPARVFFFFFFADLHGEQKQNLKHVGHSGRFLPHRLKATQWHVNKHAQVFFTAHSSCSLIIQCGRLFNPKLVLALFFISPPSSKVKQEAALFAVKKQTNYHLSSC